MLRTIAKQALDLVYPHRCVGCGQFGTPLCDACVAGVARGIGPGRCSRCSAAWADATTTCDRCGQLQALDGVRAAFEMEGAARKAVHELKYRYARSLAPVMAAHMAWLAEEVRFDAALAVPLHPTRYRERGFNQADVLLDRLAWRRPEGKLRRVRRTDRQVGRHLGERRANVRSAFAFEGERLDGCCVVLVDDVVTTGATANECAATLRAHGAERVYVLAFARASWDPAHQSTPIRD